MKREKIANNIYFNSYIDNKFKNNILTVRFIVPLNKKTASQYAIIPYLLTMSNNQYDSITKINKKLYDLYGSDLWGSVEKLGGYQVLSVGINFIDNKYSLKLNDFENINQECFDLLISVLKEPDCLDGFFKEKNIEIAKNILVNKIKNKFNNKVLYSIDRCKELMFEKSNVENLSVEKFGTEDDVKLLNRQKITDAYQDMINRSKIEISYVGNQCDLVDLKRRFQDVFKREREDKDLNLNFDTSLIKKEVLRFEEKININQCNLVLGFKLLEFEKIQEKIHGFMLMNLLFGGTPFSKLFMNVREKMSLCYNCVSKYDKFSNSIIVFIGLESENIDKAVEEVQKQLEEIKLGNFSEEDLCNIKATIKNTFLKSKDSLGDMDAWIFKQNMLGFSNNIDQEIRLVEKVSRNQIIEAAKFIKLDTIYSLKGDCQDEQDK